MAFAGFLCGDGLFFRLQKRKAMLTICYQRYMTDSRLVKHPTLLSTRFATMLQKKLHVFVARLTVPSDVCRSYNRLWVVPSTVTKTVLQYLVTLTIFASHGHWHFCLGLPALLSLQVI